MQGKGCGTSVSLRQRRLPLSRQKTEPSRLKIIPLGGLEQIGMNITAFEYEDSIVVVDCGLAFPEDDMYGIDMVIPDTTYLEENIDKVKGFVITHGHEDHIGALPYVLQKVNVPVYATRLTMGLIENKLEEHGMLEMTHRTMVHFGQTVNLGKFRVEFIKTNHSIVDAAALAIYSPVGTVIHTGDFKVDYTPVYGDAIDLQRFAELGKNGVLALLADSTNAERPGFTPSEKTVGVTIDRIFAEHKDSRIIIATFASNVDRVQQIINSASKYGRKVVVEGRSMVQVIAIAQQLGCIKIPKNTLIETDDLRNYPDNKQTIITTGSQGESMASLTRMAEDTHRKIKIKPGDTIIFSSHPIPGNEKSVTNVINKLLVKGANVIFQDVHVSGHPCQEDLKLIYSLVKPKYAVPVHGEYRHLIAQAKIAESLGIPKENIIILRSGNVLEMDQKSAKVTGNVPTGAIMVDGLGVGDIGNAVLRDRQHLAEDGIVIVSFAMDSEDQVVGTPEIASRGFVYIKEAEALMNGATLVVQKTLDDAEKRGITDRNRIRTLVKDALSDFFWKKTERRPMILPMILEV
ncbi:MAG: ribonuclease J [Lachnospiraceae bacterium]